MQGVILNDLGVFIYGDGGVYVVQFGYVGQVVRVDWVLNYVGVGYGGEQCIYLWLQVGGKVGIVLSSYVDWFEVVVMGVYYYVVIVFLNVYVYFSEFVCYGVQVIGVYVGQCEL